MHFKDAAFEILKREKVPLHYKKITELAQQERLLDSSGLTPEASMGALLYTDTLKPESRFRRGDQKGTFTLRLIPHAGIDEQIHSIDRTVRIDLLKHLHKIHPKKFEELIKYLLIEMGFEEIETAPPQNDKGVDIRGVLKSNQLSSVRIAIQAKRWKGNVGSVIVRNLRGSLRVADSEQGLIITPSNYTPEAVSEASAPGKTPITLIDGEELVDLLIQYKVGVVHEQYVVPSIDKDYWTDILGITLEDEITESGLMRLKSKESNEFPIKIKGNHKGVDYSAELLDSNGMVRFNGKDYQTPTQAAKVITVDWKSVNGWDFWRYQDHATGKLKRIGILRKKS